MGPAHPHQDQRLLVDEVLLLDCQLPRVHAGKQGLWLWLRLRLWRHHNGCEYGRQSGWTSAMAELPALCPLCPLGPRQHPPSSSPYLRRDTVVIVQPYLAWRGPPPLLASWARVQASWLAGIRASASSLSTLREQGPPPGRSLPGPTDSLPSAPGKEKSTGHQGASQSSDCSCVGIPGHACLCCWAGRPWVLSPALTHGIAALLHGPHGAPSLHAATQSPALLQILKGQKSQVPRSELEP